MPWLSALAAFALACSQATEPVDNGGPNPNAAPCVTDLTCDYGEECQGGGCAPIAPGIYTHIQTASALLRTYLDDGELEWRAEHFDLLIGQVRADELRAHNPNLRLFDYFNTRYLINTSAAAEWAGAHGANIEDFYLHYKLDTTVPGWETTQLVPGFPVGQVPGWDPPNTMQSHATARSQSRVPGFANGLTSPWYLANVANPQYRAFLADHVTELLNGTYWTSGFTTGPIDGVMCDNAIYYPAFNEGIITRTAEYWGINLTDSHPYAQAFGTLYPELATKMLTEFSSTKDVMPNYGHVLFLNYPNQVAAQVQTTTPWIWGEVWVTYTGTWSPTSGGTRCITYEKDYVNAVREIVEQTRSGGRRIVGARDTANGNLGTDRGKLFTLGLYYLLHNRHTYYMYETLSGHGNGNHISMWGWNPAVQYDIGQPAPIPNGSVDFAGNSGTVEHYVMATGSDPYAPALTYRVLARRFANALVMVKMLPEGSVTDDRSITTHTLPEPHAVLNADGTLGATVSEIQLRNNEAAILIPLTATGVE